MKLTINSKSVVVDKGSTVLEAAEAAGISIPTMCRLKGYAHMTSCMVCVVKEMGSGRLLPSCTAPAAEGMVIETDNEEVHHARRTALNLLLSEHVGDCEAPCRLTCPAHMNIPLMIRQIKAGEIRDAIETVKEDIALPAVLGRICPAPCEKGCRRSRCDSSVAICLLKRFVADTDLAARSAYMPACKPATGKSVAIIGAGPAGLSAAYYLARAGIACTVFDDRDLPGGQLRYGVPEEKLPRAVLDAEIELIKRLGVAFRMKVRVGADVSIDELKKKYNAIVLAPGKIAPHAGDVLGVKSDGKTVTADPHTFRTSDAAIFAGGEAVHPGHLAVRSCAHGRMIACSVEQYLGGKDVRGLVRRFDSRMGKVEDVEIFEFMKDVDTSPGVEPASGASGGFSVEEAVKETARCMHCDCRKASTCELRDLADRYGANQKHFNVEGRKRFERITTHSSVIFEPGKCIKCGICVRISERAHEKLGMTFVGRGFDAFVGVPFNESLGAGLESCAEECVKKCPTGALAFKSEQGS